VGWLSNSEDYEEEEEEEEEELKFYAHSSR
jgi:hypothetical protein